MPSDIVLLPLLVRQAYVDATLLSLQFVLARSAPLEDFVRALQLLWKVPCCLTGFPRVIEPPLQAVVDDATTTGEDKSDEDKSDDIAPPKPKRNANSAKSGGSAKKGKLQ
ncbi:uncharacterized protein LOC124688153 [Lolium rigidum]|uniref:uncharacterized protein LOC124688153 n=1 Tax=Lolium rigidum TaxID=89674 RepID=UPI001F5CCBA8|nr:uncharacterized protein LOC124688153 [Lolium rigidum]